VSRADEIEDRWRAIGLLSQSLEESDGWDSLHTMETNYPTDDETGATLCVFPGCQFRRHEPRAMFVHVHFGPHGASYNMDIDEFARVAAESYPKVTTEP
jgi:hypothetical protein